MSGPVVADRCSGLPLYPPSPWEAFKSRVFYVCISVAVFALMAGLLSVIFWCWLSLSGIVK